ncbi:MarR family winged helix-turn-helix transcriptional regulator [Microbacterium sp. B2969]|uniref:MarR family winged helix-turn-helix transcriptional regulator n=1 Tax=Microbacterium alkaliflavum TaxID=3248839 RepID=A0ABW7Q8N5_9MICO
MNVNPSIIDLVSLAGGAVDAHVVRALEDAGYDGLRVRHGYVFQRLLVEPTSITRLADALEVSQQAMSKTIAELVDFGYVAASPDPADARRRVLALTDAGRGAVETARQARRSLEDAVTRAVGTGRRDDARTALEALLATLGVGGRVGSRSVPIPAE